ncbi:hypothetical protein [Paenibacillus sp. OV219]|uniref:hypothetical protein n=1 Tax=Paenibacillus sp. OV219 TaxID=1884377 RepID=UPI0008B4A2E5|nr:hypothetical protein [Paenibacillus sp. OV219]SEN12655.1 hypothetical protein SAMN05518847_102220 [Paenibacillus sp. OV219]
MKRYWFSILLVIFILGSVGTYYVTAAARSFPEYKLLTVSGDDNEAKSLVLQGESKDYGSLEINAKGSLYFQEKSFFDSFRENEMFKYSPDLQQMLKDHRNFMRGKKTYNGFYQDGQVLAYADIKGGNDLNNRNYRLSVTVLDLKNNDKISFTASIPKQEKYNWISTSDVQVKGQTMTVITYNLKKASGNQQNTPGQEIHSYTIDLNKKSIAEDRVLLADKRLADGRIVTYNFIQSSQTSESSELLVYQQVTQKFAKDKEGNEVVESSEQAILTYDLASGKTDAVPAFTSQSNSNSTSSQNAQFYVSGDSIIELASGGAGTNVEIYSTSDRSVRSFEIPYLPTSNVVVYGDRLYMATPDGDTTKVIIADLKQGKVVFVGAVDINEQGNKHTELLKKLQIQWLYLDK